MEDRDIKLPTGYEAKFDRDRWAVTWTVTGATAYSTTWEDALERLQAAVNRMLDRGRGSDG